MRTIVWSTYRVSKSLTDYVWLIRCFPRSQDLRNHYPVWTLDLGIVRGKSIAISSRCVHQESILEGGVSGICRTIG